MKKILMMMVALLTLTVVMAQGENRERRAPKKMTPAEMTKRMVKDLEPKIRKMVYDTHQCRSLACARSTRQYYAFYVAHNNDSFFWWQRYEIIGKFSYLCSKNTKSHI